MKLPCLQIRNFSSEFPVIQAGMGVRVGMAPLASEVIRCGGMGTIASVGLGDIEKSKRNYEEESCAVLAEEIRAARRMTNGKGPLGVNIMVALSIYEAVVRTTVREKVEYIISGAGLPIYLPEYVGKDADIALIPVISSGRSLDVIMKAWKRRYARKPDAIIVESPLCGGHLGFSMEELACPETRSVEILLREARDILKNYDCRVPVLAAGAISNRCDIEAMIRLGFDGVQIGTRFICLEESGMPRAGKELYVKARPEDVVIIKSPVGMPVRVLKTPLVERVMAGERERFSCPYRCLRTCDCSVVPFCIAKALLDAWKGDVANGLFMTGCDVEGVTEIVTTREFFDTLKGESPSPSVKSSVCEK